jgi:hypothetical protein
MSYFLTREAAKIFIGQATGNLIAFNPAVDKFILLDNCSKKDALTVIREYEAIRLRAYCLSLMDRAKGKPIIKAFKFGGGGLAVLRSAPLIKEFKIIRPYAKNLEAKFAAMSVKDQQAFFRDRMPTSFEGAARLFASNGIKHSLHSDFKEFLQSSGSVMKFMNILATLAVMPNTNITKIIELNFTQGSREIDANFLIQRAKELLTLFHARGLVLFPLTYKRSGKGIKSASHDLYASQSQMTFLTNCARWTGYFDKGLVPGQILKRIDMLLHATTINEVGDLSNDLLQAYDEVMFERRVDLATLAAEDQEILETGNKEIREPNRSLAQQGRCAAVHSSVLLYRKVMKTIKALYEYTYPDAPLTYLPTIKAHPTHSSRTTDTRWMAESNPSFGEWADVVDAFLNRKRAREVKTDMAERLRLNKFIDFLLTLDDPPLCPEEIIRERHIYDEGGLAITYWQSLNDDENLSIDTKNRYLKSVHDFFFWYGKRLQREKLPGWEEFTNPIDWEADRWRGAEHPYQTHRPAVSVKIVELMKRIITENDYAFCRDRERFPEDHVWVYDRDSQQRVEVWFPGRAVLLTILLYLPARSFQARWMDSGEGDEFIVNFAVDPATKQMLPEMVRNNDARSTPKRQVGALQIVFTTLEEPCLATHLSTNKTGDYVAAGKKKGHTIPWCPDEVRDGILMMQQWQRRYGQYIDKPIEAIDISKRDRRREKRNYDHKVEVYPLFRDPTRILSEKPVSRERLEKFYFEVLYTAQEIISEHNPQLKPFITKAIKTKRETGKKRKVRHAIKEAVTYVTDHDLHGLRVTGITNLMEAGVPVEIISKMMAGHKTIFMTVFYGKFDPLKIREYLEKANEIAKERSSEGYKEEWLLSRRDGDAIVPIHGAMTEADGTWNIQIDGICPGTRCEEGGPLIGKNKSTRSPVPESRCPLCRFWLTGPRFLSGLDIEMNRLFHKVHRDEQKVKALNEDLTRLEIKRDNGDSSVQGHINVLYGQLNKLHETRSYDLQEMSARKLWMDTIIKMLESGQERALITGNDEQGLKVVIQQGHYIHLLHRQSLATEIVVGFQNEQAVMELKGMLETMLALNGRISPLARLNPELQLRSINLLTDFLVQAIPDDDDMQRILSGESSLEQIYLPDNTTLGRKIDLVCQAISDRTVLSKIPDRPQSPSAPYNPHPGNGEAHEII